MPLYCKNYLLNFADLYQGSVEKAKTENFDFVNFADLYQGSVEKAKPENFDFVNFDDLYQGSVEKTKTENFDFVHFSFFRSLLLMHDLKSTACIYMFCV